MLVMSVINIIIKTGLFGTSNDGVWCQHRHTVTVTVTVTIARFFWQFCWSWVWELSARLPWDFWDFLTACCLCLCCQHRQHHHRHRHHYGQHCRLVLMGRRAKGLEISRIFWLTHFRTMPLCTLFFLGLCHRLCHLDHCCNNVDLGAADVQINSRVVTPHCSALVPPVVVDYPTQLIYIWIFICWVS